MAGHGEEARKVLVRKTWSKITYFTSGWWKLLSRVCPAMFKEAYSKVDTKFKTKHTRRWLFTLLFKNMAQEWLPSRSWAQKFVQASLGSQGRFAERVKLFWDWAFKALSLVSASLASDDTQERMLNHSPCSSNANLPSFGVCGPFLWSWCLWSLPLVLAPQPHFLKTLDRREHPFLALTKISDFRVTKRGLGL